MQPATLGGVPGAGEVRWRRRTDSDLEYRGTFAFRRQHEPAIIELCNSRLEVEYEGAIGDASRKLRVVLTDLSLERGIAYFQGVGEPY